MERSVLSTVIINRSLLAITEQTEDMRGILSVVILDAGHVLTSEMKKPCLHRPKFHVSVSTRGVQNR